MKPHQLAVGALGFVASVVSGYLYARPVKELSQHAEQQDGTSSCAFDRLADIYDDVIGSEERYMWYGLFRKWLLRKAQGDVLEISAGTGRNLPHYKYNNITTLILTDLSPPMLQQAQDKYFEDLQLQYKYPDLSVKFQIADAENLVAEDDQTPVTVPLHRHKYSSSSSSGSRASDPDISDRAGGGGGAGQQQQSTCGVWRFKSQHQQQKSQQQQQQQQIHAEQQQDVALVDNAVTAATEQRQQQQQQQSAGSVWRFRARQQQQQQQQAYAEQQQGVASVDNAVPAAAPVYHSSGSPPAGISTASSSSWWPRKQQQQHRPSPPCCQDHSCCNGSSSSSSSDGVGAAAAVQGSTFAPGSFDTVVDTFGLCSCEDPVKVLQQASRLLKPGGKLLLLEHGKSSWSWLDDYMNQRAPAHYKTYGCWYNRDIGDIVQKAGLQIESFSRWHFGTSYLIVASPPPATVQAPATLKATATAVQAPSPSSPAAVKLVSRSASAAA